MNRREDPLLQQHRTRLLQLAEVTNIKPGHGTGKKRQQQQKASSGFASSNDSSTSRIALQDIIRSDAGYAAANIDRLVFPDRHQQSSNGSPSRVASATATTTTTLGKSKATSSAGTGRSRLADVFARHYPRGRVTQESATKLRKNQVNKKSTVVDNEHHQPPAIVNKSGKDSREGRRWLSTQQLQWTRSGEDVSISSSGLRGGNNSSSSNNVGVAGGSISSNVHVPLSVPSSRRVSPATDSTEISDSTTGSSRSDRGPNVTVLQLHGGSFTDPWEMESQESSYSVCSTRSQGSIGARKPTTKYNGSIGRSSYGCVTSIASLKRNNNPTTAASNPATGSLKLRSENRAHYSSGDFLVSEKYRDSSWCDREVDGIFLNRSGWVQVQQRSLDDRLSIRDVTPLIPPLATDNNYSSRGGSTHNVAAPPRRPTIKLANYHCNSEPGFANNSQDSQRPDFLALQDYDKYESQSACNSPHSISESSPPSLTPIISPPPAFQDISTKPQKSVKSENSSYGKPPFLPRSNAIVTSDLISPPGTPGRWSSSLPASRKTTSTAANSTAKTRRPTNPVAGQQKQPKTGHQQQYRLAPAKSLEDQSNVRRSKFAQKYVESSSSSSSSLGFRSLDSCVTTRSAMPCLAENTDSSIEGYEDGDEDDNPSLCLNADFPTIGFPAGALHSSQESVLKNGGKVSPSNRRHRSSQALRRSSGSLESGKQLSLNSSSSSTSSSFEVPGRSPKLSSFKKSSYNKHGSRGTLSSPDSVQSRVRRSRSLQLPPENKKSPAGPNVTAQPVVNYHFKEARMSNAKNNGIDRSSEKAKRHLLMSSKIAQSAEDVLRDTSSRDADSITEYLYGTRSRSTTRNVSKPRYNPRDDNNAEMRKNSLNTYDVYFVPAKQQQQQPQKNNSTQATTQNSLRRPRTLQRGASTPSASLSPENEYSSITNDTKLRCNSSTCDFWPHCYQRDTLYSTTQSPAFMKVSQSYPAHQRLSTDSGVYIGCNSACSSPASLERMDDRETTKKSKSKKTSSKSKYQERYSKTIKRQTTMVNGNAAEQKCQDCSTCDYNSGCEMCVAEQKMAAKNCVGRSPSNGQTASSSTATSSSSSSDIWITTSERTVTKSPGNPKSSGASTPLEEDTGSMGKITSENAKEERPDSAPARRDNLTASCDSLDPYQRSLSLPKSFLHNNEKNCQTGSWKRGYDSQRSTPSPNYLRTQEPPESHTAPVSPQHDSQSRKDRRRGAKFSKAQKHIKAASTPALIDQTQDSKDKRPSDNDNKQVTKEYPIVEAKIPLLPHPCCEENVMEKDQADSGSGASQIIHHQSGGGQQQHQESVLQKFRKSFSLRFNNSNSKKGSKDGIEQPEQQENNEQESNATPSATTSNEHQQANKDEPTSDQQKFRFGPLVWRSSKERKKHGSKDRSSKCNSGDSGIQIEGDLQNRSGSRHHHVRRTNSDLGGQRLLQWDTRPGYAHMHNYNKRMLSTPSPIKTRPPRLSPRHSSHDIVALRSSAKGRCNRSNLRRSLSQPLGINQLSPLMRPKTSGTRMLSGNVLSEDEQDVRGYGTSDDEVMSDASQASYTDKKNKSFELTMDEEVGILAEALWDHVAMESEELVFRAGDVIDVLDTADKDWWWGTCRGQHGWFPAAFVRLRVNQGDTVEDCLAAIASGKSSNGQLRRRTSLSLLSNEQVRTSVVREMVQTERDFVKMLRDIVDGYIVECRRRIDMFSEEQIETIFINLEELLDFQSEFLRDLEACIDWTNPHKSCIGECFLSHKSGFRIYSEYCNSHPMAIVTLQELYQHSRYNKFFEACRLMRGLIEIPLDGYLLTPVQRICKYPLQLAELLKYTKPDHPDCHKIQEALNAMRDVAVLINERKRRMESLEKLAAWQLRVEGWEGEDLIEVSSQLIYQGDVVRVTSGMWTNNITLFLFDYQLVYCKKDILKRNTYVFKGRIYLDTSDVIDVPDGKDLQLGVTVRHCLKIYSCVRDKWLLFCCRSAEDKRRWLLALAEERKLVAQDKNDGLEFPLAARQLARFAACRQHNRPPIKPRMKLHKTEAPYELAGMGNHMSTNSLGRKVGTWFTFGSNKKNMQSQVS